MWMLRFAQHDKKGECASFSRTGAVLLNALAWSSLNEHHFARLAK